MCRLCRLCAFNVSSVSAATAMPCFTSGQRGVFGHCGLLILRGPGCEKAVDKSPLEKSGHFLRRHPYSSGWLRIAATPSGCFLSMQVLVLNAQFLACNHGNAMLRQQGSKLLLI